MQLKDNKVIVIKKYIAGDTLDETFKKVQNSKDYLEKMCDLQIEINKAEVDLPRKYSDKLKEYLGRIEVPNKDLILNRINRLKENHLCHEDLHPQNIIVNNDKLVAIDWNNAVCGDPLLDVARTYMFFENHSKGVGDVYLNMYEKKTYIKKETV